MADPDIHDPDGLWKLLTKTLPAKSAAEDPHLPFCLAVAWVLLPERHNFWLDRADYDPAPTWFQAWPEEITQIRKAIDKFEKETEQEQNAELELGSIDPDSTRDWDDAICVTGDGEGYTASVALACPALAWPFDSELDKAVLRRATSLYLP